MLSFCSIGTRVDATLERVRSLELVPRPELGGDETERQPFGRDRQARMHQQATLGVHARLAVAVAPGLNAADRAELVRPAPLVDELGRVLDHEQRPVAHGAARGGRGEVAGQDRVLAEALVGEEAVGRLAPRPVLAGKWQRLTHRRAEPAQERSEPLNQATVAQVAAGDLGINPRQRLLGPLVATQHAAHPG
jgi:hypothetical protein